MVFVEDGVGEVGRGSFDTAERRRYFPSPKFLDTLHENIVVFARMYEYAGEVAEIADTERFVQ